MARRSSARHCAFADAYDVQKERTAEQHQSGSRPTLSNSVNVDRPTSRPMKRLRTTTTCAGGSSPLQAHASTSSRAPVQGARGSTRASTEQPPVSLARLPLDILLRIGHFLSPLPVARTLSESHHASGWKGNAGTATCSEAWLDYGADLVRFSSTCRATWAGVRNLVGRSFGCDARLTGNVHGGNMVVKRAKRRLRCIVADEKYDAAVLSARKREEKEAPRLDRVRPIASHEFIPASRIRHLFVAADAEDGFNPFCHIKGVYHRRRPHIDNLVTLSEVLALKLPLLTNLESVALVWKDERSVVSTAPYHLSAISADVLTALVAHPTLRDLFTCGIKWSHRFSDGSTFPVSEVEGYPPFRFGLQIRSLTLNASADSGLGLVSMAPGLREVRMWRDFTSVPRGASAFWWTEETWQTVERVDLTGFSSEQAEPLLRQMIQQLSNLRALPVPPLLPLHTLRLSEPYQSSTVRNDLLPALAHLPHLRSFTVFVWNDRTFGAGLLRSIWEAMPDLEELGIGLESECLQWWPGSLVDYAAILKRFLNLRTFTWNYSPYADLDYPSTRKHVHPFLLRSLAAPTYAPSSFSSLHWFGEPIYFRRLSPSLSASSFSDEWKWSDDAVFERRMPAWVEESLQTEEEWEGESRVGGWMDESGSLGENEDAAESADPVEVAWKRLMEEEKEGVMNEVQTLWAAHEADRAHSTLEEAFDALNQGEEDDEDEYLMPGHRRRPVSTKGKCKCKAVATVSRPHAATSMQADEEDEEEEKENLTVTFAQSLARSSSSSSASTSRRSTAAASSAEGPTNAKAKKKGRKSIGELLREAQREAVKEGKKKALSPAAPPASHGAAEGRDLKGGAQDDSGFWEMEVADL
ncbi:hypothetical protein JCM11251_003803 [Rhodosporidiobolus azoricus]